MAQKIPINIPVFISDQNYNPNRVLPRLFFYNGTLESEEIWLGNPGGSATAIYEFPYFDHYNVISGSFPTTGSRSLLFNNESPAYGSIPTENLYTTYWSKYVNMLYNPKTRLINASAIIPLADYFDMELNDIVNWRGNYYHLRAINDYNLKTGECKIQLLGPIIADALDGYVPPTPTAYSYVSWSLDETNADTTLTLSTNGTTRATATTDTGSNFRLTGSQWVTASMVGAGTWGTNGPTTMSLVVSSSGYTFNGTSTTYGTPVTTTFTGSANTTYSISASTQYNPGTAVNFEISQSCYQNDGVVKIFNPTGGYGNYQFNEAAYFSEASALAATTNWVTTGSITFNDMPDGTLWFALRDGTYPTNLIAKSASINCNSSSTGCYTTASFTVGISTAEVFWIDCCGNGSSSFFEVGNHIISGCISVGSISSPDSVGNPEYYGISCSCVSPPAPTSASLAWSFNESGTGVVGNMDLYVNGSIVESRSTNTNGVWPVYLGDTISVVVSTSGCTNPDIKANSYTLNLIADASCANNSTTLTTSTYTVLSGDIGTTLNLNAYSRCDGGCV